MERRPSSGAAPLIGARDVVTQAQAGAIRLRTAGALLEPAPARAVSKSDDMCRGNVACAWRRRCGAPCARHRIARQAASSRRHRSEPQRRADGDHRRRSGVHGLDDLAAVDALEVDGRDAEVAVAELALDDDQRHAFAGHLDGVGVAELVWREAAPHSCRGGGAPELGACCGGRPAASARCAVDDAKMA
jgi:hypothetical protein